MAAETNVIKRDDLAKVRSVDFTLQFVGNLNKLVEALGVTRKIAVAEGTALKTYKVTGTLQDGTVAEGDIIPLSKYVSEEVTIAEAEIKKWRKSTTAEAIVKSGYDHAVGETTDTMVRDIQKGIRASMFGSLATGTGEANGSGLQAALADGWGQLQILFEDDAVETVFFINPLNVSAYLGTAQITTQTAFGMTYIENFLGLGTAILNSSVPKGKFYATAKENLIMAYINMNNGDLANAFDLIVDETGYIGIHEYADNDRACVNDLVMSGIIFFPERVDGVVVGTIAGE